MTDSATTTIECACRVRLRPKPGQARTSWWLFGAKRFVWNGALRRKDDVWRTDGTQLTGEDVSREFTALRAAGDRV